MASMTSIRFTKALAKKRRLLRVSVRFLPSILRTIERTKHLGIDGRRIVLSAAGHYCIIARDIPRRVTSRTSICTCLLRSR
jgi:hypothetical protein